MQSKLSVVRSFLFKFLESCGTQGIAFVVSVLLARVLDASDYGVLTLLVMFVSVFQVFVQSGMNTAITQKKEIDETDLSSAFYLSLGIAAGVYALLFALAPLIATLMNHPELRAPLRVFALVLFPNAFTVVQNGIVARRMAFKTLMFSSLCVNVLSGGIGIAMAYGGCGYWALVAQQVSNQTLLAVALLLTLDWRPRLLFSRQRVRALFGFSWKLMVSGLIETVYNNLRNFVIGLKYDTAALGFFNRGKQFPELVMSNVNNSIQSVMLPVLSSRQEDLPGMKAAMRRSILLSSFAVFPLMMGLALAARPLVTLLLTDKWLPCVPFLQVCCVDFAFYPIHTANLQAINARGRSDVFLRLELIKKSYGVVILLIAVFCFDSAFAIAASAAASTLIAFFVNAAPNKRLLGYSYREQLRDLLPALLATLCMGAAVWAVGLLALPAWLLLAAQALTGVGVYTLLTRTFRLEAFGYLAELLRSLLGRKASNPDTEGDIP